MSSVPTHNTGVGQLERNREKETESEREGMREKEKKEELSNEAIMNGSLVE